MTEQKIGTVEIMKVSTHSGGLYLRIKNELAEAFGIRKGDKLRVKIISLVPEGQA